MKSWLNKYAHSAQNWVNPGSKKVLKTYFSSPQTTFKVSRTLCSTSPFPSTRPALDPGPQLHLSSLIPNVAQLDSNTSFTKKYNSL